MSSEDILHKVITGVPINSTARDVAENRGSVRFEYRNTDNRPHWDTCPAIKKLPPDLTGKKFGGGMLVMGLWAEGNGLWVCRCRCGHFEVRRAAAICNPCNYEDSCYQCYELRRAKRRSTFRQTGRYPDEAEVKL